ncbi:MAG: glucose-6-phosphate dehydrogenase [Phycisphaerae bacterium]|nr:glucose-6-phosphate dehydrogenase [Phycisphaerae bacterium]
MTQSLTNNNVPCVMIIFGASGDLTRRKLIPALYNLESANLLPEQFKIVGFARSELNHDSFRNELKNAVETFSKNKFDPSTWQRFESRLFYVTGHYDNPDDFQKLNSLIMEIKPCEKLHYLFYLALPPETMETVLKTMEQTQFIGKCRSPVPCRIMIEKPFGNDLAGARRLNQMLSNLFEPEHIYRIDHYIAKDTIRNLLVLRFANAVFEPIWNRNYIDSVQITAAEKIGVEGRGSYYEQSGVVRDMVQNHVMQVLTLIAMESPVVGYTGSIDDQKLQVLKSLSPIQQQDFVFGQYHGYRNEKNVDPNSKTPTYVAVKLAIHNWRWFGVPFYIRCGKNMAQSMTQVVINFKRIPLCVMENPALCRNVQSNRLIIRLQPDEGISLLISVKTPQREDRIEPVHLDFRYASMGMKMPEAYERILLDGLLGDPTLFWSAASIEAAWKAVEPLIATPCPDDKIFSYEPGTWGPQQADDLLRQDEKEWL